MSAPRPPEEIFLEIMREESAEPGLSFEQAMAKPFARTLFDTVVKTFVSEPVAFPTAPIESHQPLSSLVTSKEVIIAALQDTFDLTELNANASIRAALLAASDLVMVNGLRRLRMHDSARATLLESCKGMEPYQTILREAVEKDKDQHAEVGAESGAAPFGLAALLSFR